MSNPLRSLLLGFGITVEGKEKLDEVDSSVENIIKKVQKLGSGLASLFVLKGITSFIDNTIEVGRNLEISAEKIGVTVDELERFRYAANMSGVGVENAERALMMFNRQLGEAEIGTKGALKGVGQLGTGATATQLATMPLNELLGKVADKMASLTDRGARAQLAVKLFGRSGMALIPMLEQGSEGFKKWNAEFDALGGGIGEDFAKKAKEAGDGIKRLSFAFEVLKTRIVSAILPAVEKVVGWFTKFILHMEWLEKNTYAAQTALIFLAGAALVAFAPFLASILPIVAAFTALYLIFDDIFAMFRGGNSELGDFIDMLFGEGSHKTFVEEVKKGFKEFIEWIKETAIPAFKEFWAEAGKEWKALGGLRALGDFLHSIWAALKGIGEAIGDLASGNWRKALDDLNKGGTTVVRDWLGGKTDAEMNADAKAEAQKKADANIWNSVADPTVPILPGMPLTSGGAAGENGMVGGVSSFEGYKPPDVKVDVHVKQSNASPEDIAKAAKDGVSDGVDEAVKRAIQNRPWAPGMPIPKPATSP